jgi:hypothetical protein
VDAFEAVVARLFEVQGFWTRIGLKVELTKEQKRELKNPSMPRPEIDIVAFKPSTNELLVVECKSYMDSFGVRMDHFECGPDADSDKFKMLNRPTLREVVTRSLVSQLRAEGLLLKADPTVRYFLVAGRIYSDHEDRIRAHFKSNGWTLVGPAEIAEGVRKFADRGYENDLITIVAKILERSSPTKAAAGR